MEQLQPKADLQRALEERIRLITENVTDVISVHAPDGTYLYVSPSCRAMIGYEPDELIGRNVYEFFHPKTQEIIRNSYGHPANMPDMNVHDYRFRRKDGQYIWVETSLRLLRDPNSGELVEFIAISRDVSARRSAEIAFRKQEARYRAAAQASLDAFFILRSERDETGRIVDFLFEDVNHNGETLLQLSREQIVGQRLSLIVPISGESSRFQKYLQVVETRAPVDEEFQADTPLMQGQWFQHQIVPLEDGIAITTRNITGRKQAETALQTYADRLRLLHEIDQAILAAGSVQDITQTAVRCVRQLVPCDRAALVMYNYERDGVQIVAQDGLGEKSFPVNTILPLADYPPLDLLKQGQVRYVRDLAAAQQLAPVIRRLLALGLQSYISLPLLVEGQLIGVLSVSSTQKEAFNQQAIDIGRQFADQIAIALQQARMSEQMRRYVQRLQILHNIDQAILRAQSRDEIAGAVIRYIRQLVPCERAGLSIYDFHSRTASIIAMDVDTGQPLPPPQFPLSDAIDLDSLLRGEMLYVEDLDRYESDSPLMERQRRYGMRSCLVVPLTAEGTLLGVLSLSSAQVAAFDDEAQNITRQLVDQLAIAIWQTRLNDQIRAHADELERRVAERTAELAAANERLMELDALKSKFVSDVSHELRTPVAGLNTRLYLLERSRPEEYAKHIGILKEQIAGLNKLIENILDLSRIDLSNKAKLEFAPVDLNSVVTQVCVAYEAMAQMAGLELFLEPGLDMPPVRGERNQIAQVVTNLVANAINYTPAGSVRLATWYDAASDSAYLSVQDTGIGIDDDDLPHIFERFYRGERAGQSNIRGTGLGLGIVKEIVDLHDGSISVKSAVNQGSVFTVSFPVVRQVHGDNLYGERPPSDFL